MNETNDITLKCTVPPVLGVTHYKKEIGSYRGVVYLDISLL